MSVETLSREQRRSVPRTRPEQDRDDKMAEILDVAERQLLSGGYPALSMIGTARELGVAQNAVYWYFPSKDDLFVAVLRRLMGRVMTRKPPAERGLVDQAIWIVDRLADFHALNAVVHERARSSAVIGQFHREFQTLLHGMLSGALTPLVPPEELEVATSTFLSTVEGTLLRQVPRRERQAIVRYTLERILGPTYRSEPVRGAHR